jgi:hypothetical protein
MKKKIIYVLIALYALSISSASAQQEKSETVFKLKKLWETPDILTTSESVCYHNDSKSLFVSCINGNPTDKDGNGFIAQVSITGEIITLKWVDGLNAPKGMGIYKNSLFVTDIDQVVELNLTNAEIIRKYGVADAKFLNDITIDKSGTVYISDMSTGKIHRIKDNILETWFEHEQIISPNGLFFEDDELLIGTKNGIYSVRIEDKRLWHLIKDTGGIDGLEADGNGNYVISDWVGKVQLVSERKKPIVLMNTSDKGMNAADIEFIPDRNMLLVPTFHDNRVMAYELVEE